MDKAKTERGFDVIEFEDDYGHSCSLQKSSVATRDCIWLGIDNASPQIMASDTQQGGTGWVDYHIPDNVLLWTRMHLNRQQVRDLLPYLQQFADTGDII